VILLLQLEQHYLDILFSLPANLRYNFLPTAGSSLGYKHTEDALAKISGANNPMYGKVPASAFQSGYAALNPMYGKTHTSESRAKMSDSQKLVDRSGANHPMYGKVPASAFSIRSCSCKCDDY